MTSLLEKHSEHLDMKFTDELLILLTLQIENMEEIAPHFNMSPDDIQQIQREKQTSTGRVVSMLSKWRERNRERATCRSLVNIFIESGHCNIINAIISNIRDKYIPSTNAVAVPFDPITYPNWNDLNDSHKEIVRNRLRAENISVRNSFAVVLADIQSSLHSKVNHTEVMNYLAVAPGTKKLEIPSKYNEVNNIFDVVKVLIKAGGCNWLNYHYLDIVVNKYGSNNDKAKMADYIRKLLLYLQRSFYEIPPDSIGCNQQSKFSCYFVIPLNQEEDFENITGEHMKLVQKMLAEKFELDLGNIEIEIKAGSIRLNFVVSKKLLEKKQQLMDTTHWLELDPTDRNKNSYLIKFDQLRSKM